MLRNTVITVVILWKLIKRLTLMKLVKFITMYKITNLNLKKGVLRGLHFQKKYPQAKLVRCIEGEVFDVCVDLRPGSPTYGKWEGVVLSAEKGNQFMIPRGFAHGFLVLSETATFCYKVDEFYHPEDEGGLAYDDPDIGVEWPDVGEILLSEKDKKNSRIKDLVI